LYLSSTTRSDITLAVNNFAKFTANPTKEHWTAVKRIFRYLKGTINYGLLYSENASLDCVGFSDADWAGDLNDRKSTSGYTFQMSGATVSWRSKLAWHYQQQKLSTLLCPQLLRRHYG